MLDPSKMKRSERRKLLEKTVASADANLAKWKKMAPILAKYDDDIEVLELIRHGKHKDESLNDLYRKSKKLLATMAEEKYIIQTLIEYDGNDKPRDTDKESTGLHVT